jgi:hypothetical protein
MWRVFTSILASGQAMTGGLLHLEVLSDQDEKGPRTNADSADQKFPSSDSRFPR